MSKNYSTWIALAIILLIGVIDATNRELLENIVLWATIAFGVFLTIFHFLDNRGKMK
jgi:hypothetical protein